ncbi:MAG: transcription antitermination factor NusB, partial [Phycisphaerales bacterium]|nr:transcription antitermination factor NusB [Phycisphaerales bacterium]
MHRSAIVSARDYALWQLDGIELPGWKAHRLRRRCPPPEDARDIALAEQLRVGVIKNLLWLQHLISHHSGRDARALDPLVGRILALGLYQLRFL